MIFVCLEKAQKNSNQTEDWENIHKSDVLKLALPRLENSYHTPSHHSEDDRFVLHLREAPEHT